jgi:hypothetical protein
MFHSFQHGFDPFHDKAVSTSPLDAVALQDLQWISEGTANAAEESGATMARNKVAVPPLHPIDRALTASDYRHIPTADPKKPIIIHESIAYTAQDFWVYVGNKPGRPSLELGYLTGLFLRGASPDAADALFREAHQSSLAQEYWAWVKNQAVEKTVDFDDALGDPCHLDFPRDTPLIGTVPVLPHGNVEFPPEQKGTLSRLTAEVVRIIFVRDPGPITVTVEPQPGLEYKVYLNGESPCGSEIPDGERTFQALSIADMVYVLLANTEHVAGSRIAYEVQVKPAAP